MIRIGQSKEVTFMLFFSKPLKVQLENVADEKDNLSTVTLLNR